MILDKPNPLYEVYKLLNKYLKWYIESKDTSKVTIEKLDGIFKYILLNNGCKFKDNVYYIKEKVKSLNSSYSIVFVLNAMGNDKNTYYDYIDLMNDQLLIVFLDYFDGIENEPKDFIGRSMYHDAITRIVEIFISTTTCIAEINGTLGTTCAAQNYRFAGFFIASKIIDDLFGLKEDDVAHMPYEEIRKFLDTMNIAALLLGIKIKV